MCMYVYIYIYMYRGIEECPRKTRRKIRLP